MADEVTEGFLPVGTSLKALDTTVITQSDGSTEAHREAVFLADPSDTDARLNVIASKEAMKNGIGVYSTDNEERDALLTEIRDLLKVQVFHLELLTEAHPTIEEVD